MRDERAYLSHIRDAYFGVRLETVWGAVENRLPELKAHIARLLAEARQAERQSNDVADCQ